MRQDIHYNGKDRLTILARYLGNGMNSVLHGRLRDQDGLCYSVDASHYAYKKGGMFQVSAGNIDEMNKSRIIKAVDEEIEKVRQGKIDSDLLELAVNTRSRGCYHGSLEQMPARAGTICEIELNAAPSIDESLEAWLGTDTQCLQETEQRYLTERRMICGLFRSS